MTSWMRLVMVGVLGLAAACSEGGDGGSNEEGRDRPEPVRCESNAACPLDRPLCHDGFCADCLSHRDCAEPAPFCNDDGVCVACRSGADCTAELPVCGADWTCGGCSTAADCAEGESCLEGDDGRSCGPCRSDADCPAAAPSCTPSGGGATCVQPTGSYLVGMGLTLGVHRPFAAELVLAGTGSNWSATLQPLVPTTVVRTDCPAVGSPVGAAITGTVLAVEEGAPARIEFSAAAFDGCANPISSGALIANITLSGVSARCGEITGDVTTPIQASLAGSTWGAVVLKDAAAQLPDLVSSCR